MMGIMTFYFAPKSVFFPPLLEDCWSSQFGFTVAFLLFCSQVIVVSFTFFSVGGLRVVNAYVPLSFSVFSIRVYKLWCM